MTNKIKLYLTYFISLLPLTSLGLSCLMINVCWIVLPYLIDTFKTYR